MRWTSPFHLSILLTVGCAGARASDPDPAHSDEAATEESETSAEDLHGTWAYAEDPEGEIPPDPVYENSTMTFEPDGTYAFDLGVTLKGTWEKTGSEDGTLLVHTVYGSSDTETDIAVSFRRDDDGEVEGLVLREGDGSNGRRFYVRQED